MEEIEDSAFVSCTSLKKLKIPASIKYIGYFIVENCTSLEEIIIPSSVQSVDAFGIGENVKIIRY